MILLVDLCIEKDSLSKYEFVHPIADTIERSGFQSRSGIIRSLRDSCLRSSIK